MVSFSTRHSGHFLDVSRNELWADQPFFDFSTPGGLPSRAGPSLPFAPRASWRRKTWRAKFRRLLGLGSRRCHPNGFSTVVFFFSFNQLFFFGYPVFLTHNQMEKQKVLLHLWDVYLAMILVRHVYNVQLYIVKFLLFKSSKFSNKTISELLLGVRLLCPPPLSNCTRKLTQRP